MKKLYTLLTAVTLTASAFAQVPEKLSYQAVVRDAGNALVTTTGVGMQISILQGSASGTAVYVETQTPNTNINGLVSIEIGSGTLVSGMFNTIDWSNGPYFIKTETDPTGGTIYTITGTSQLMSVPYALHANTADSIIGGVSFTEVDGSVTNEIQDLQLAGNNLTITSNGTATTIDLSPYLDNTDTQLDSTDISNMGFVTTLYLDSVINSITGLPAYNSSVSLQQNLDNEVPISTILANHNVAEFYGKVFQGGYIFYIDSASATGLVVSPNDISTGGVWGSTTILTGASDQTIGSGRANTTTIINTSGASNTAAKNCDDLVLNGYFDWYLPSFDELKEIYNNLSFPGYVGFLSVRYWSSSELNISSAYTVILSTGAQNGTGKNFTGGALRAIRAF